MKLVFTHLASLDRPLHQKLSWEWLWHIEFLEIQLWSCTTWTNLNTVKIHSDVTGSLKSQLTHLIWTTFRLLRTNLSKTKSENTRRQSTTFSKKYQWKFRDLICSKLFSLTISSLICQVSTQICSTLPSVTIKMSNTFTKQMKAVKCCSTSFPKLKLNIKRWNKLRGSKMPKSKVKFQTKRKEWRGQKLTWKTERSLKISKSMITATIKWICFCSANKSTAYTNQSENLSHVSQKLNSNNLSVLSEKNILQKIKKKF